MSRQTASELLPVPRKLDESGAPRSPAPPAGPVSLSERPAGSRARRLVRWALVMLLVAATVVALRLTLLAPRPVRVDVARVEPGVVEQTVSNTRAGTVKARLRARLSPETGGRVAELPHREGEHVAQGDLLLRLDDSLQRAQLDLALEEVKAAAARADEACLAAELARRELERHRELRAGGIASEQLVDRLASEHDRGRAACRAAQASLDQARARERYVRAELRLTELRAPFAGVIAEVSSELGEWIAPSVAGASLPAVIDLIDPSSLYVTAPIDEMDAGRIRPGQAVRLAVDSHRGQYFPGHLVRVAPYVLDVVEQNRTVEVEAEFHDALVASSLLPGTSADVEVILERRVGVLQIPTGAIAQGGKVLVLRDGQLEQRNVTTGLGNWRNTEIMEGLHVGDLVVTSRDSTGVKAGARAETRALP